MDQVNATEKSTSKCEKSMIDNGLLHLPVHVTQRSLRYEGVEEYDSVPAKCVNQVRP